MGGFDHIAASEKLNESGQHDATLERLGAGVCGSSRCLLEQGETETASSGGCGLGGPVRAGCYLPGQVVPGDEQHVQARRPEGIIWVQRLGEIVGRAAVWESLGGGGRNARVCPMRHLQR